MRLDMVSNSYHVPVEISYEKWVEHHLEQMRNAPDIDVSPKTIAGHKEALDNLKLACRPKGPIEITPAMIYRFRRVQLEKGYKPRTINKNIEAIRSSLSYAVRAELIPENTLLGPHRLFLNVEQKILRILEVC